MDLHATLPWGAPKFRDRVNVCAGNKKRFPEICFVQFRGPSTLALTTYVLCASRAYPPTSLLCPNLETRAQRPAFRPHDVSFLAGPFGGLHRAARRRLPTKGVAPVFFHQCTFTCSTGALSPSPLWHVSPVHMVHAILAYSRHRDLDTKGWDQRFAATWGVACSFFPDASCPPDAPARQSHHHGMHHCGRTPRCPYRRPFAPTTCH